jgi:ABC-type nitrate/sulfonate/bicarbonate transport system substrate-binding protein
VPNPRKFVNPLTQSSETLPATETSTETETLPSTTTITYTSTLSQVKHRKRGAQAFEKTHERITLWINSELKQRFEALADEQGEAKSTLLDEAISDLLNKYEHPGIEERFRTDTQVRHFKKWIRSHDHPQDTDFFRRFLADGRLPEHASRGLYEGRMRSAGYSEEDMYMFQAAWKSMIAEDLE